MEQKGALAVQIVTNFNRFAEFHAVVSQKLDKLKTEDERIKMLEMIEFLYRNVSDQVLHSAVNESFFNPCLGHFISTLISVATADKYFRIKNAVIEIIDLIVNRLGDYYKQNRKGANPADLLASFLPGISQFLMKMITKDDKQNRSVYISSLRALSSLFCRVYLNYEDGLSDKLDAYPFLMPRTKEWRTKSVEKLNIIVELIERALIGQSVQVKESLINFTAILVFHLVDHKENHELLPLIGRNLFRIPLTLLYDKNESVRRLSTSFTERVSVKFFYQNSNAFHLQEALMDDLLKLLDDFEKEISVYSEQVVLKNLKLLCGYLNCFEQNKFNFVLFNSRNKLFDLLATIFRLDYGGMSANVLPREQTEFTSIDWFEKKFYYFESKKLMFDQLDVLCGLIVKLSDQTVLNDYLVDCLAGIGQRPEASNQITNDESSARQSADKSSSLIVLSYLVKHFDPDPLHLQVIGRLTDLLESELSEIENNEGLFIDERFELVVFGALLIELITNFAHPISKDEQRQYCLAVLYTIMACTGSTHLQIQVNAKASITELAAVFRYASVKEMLLEYLDCVISRMHIKLNNYSDKENLYSVFKIIFELTDADVCDRLDQTINNLLLAMDTHYSVVNFERLARILLLVVRTFKRWFVVDQSKTDENLTGLIEKHQSTEAKLGEFRSDLIRFLQKKEQDKEELKQFEAEMAREAPVLDEQAILDQQKKHEERENDPNELGNEEEKKLPIHIELAKRILEKCSNFLSYNLVQVRLLVLEIIVDGLDVLRLHEDSLLPTAHVVWESLIHRFKDEPVVLYKCTECLLKLAANCGDFIRARTIKQILPQIYSFLRLSWKKSLLVGDHKQSMSIDRASRGNHGQHSSRPTADLNLGDSAKHSSNAFFFSLDYRLQQLLLTQLGKLAFHIRLTRKDLWPLIVVLIQYLDDRQPIELRTAASSSLYELELLDSYAVFYFKNYHFV